MDMREAPVRTGGRGNRADLARHGRRLFLAVQITEGGVPLQHGRHLTRAERGIGFGELVRQRVLRRGAGVVKLPVQFQSGAEARPGQAGGQMA